MNSDVLNIEVSIRQWFEAEDFKNVRLEIKDTSGDVSKDDYFVVKEMTFEPKRLDQLWAQLYFTEEGMIGVGLENTKRITKRLGLPFSGRSVFLRGCEPMAINSEKCLELLQAVSSAAFELRILTLPFFGLIGGSLEAIQPREISNWNFLEYRYRNDLSRIFPDYLKKELKYAVWD